MHVSVTFKKILLAFTSTPEVQHLDSPDPANGQSPQIHVHTENLVLVRPVHFPHQNRIMRIGIHIVLIGSKLGVPDDDGALLVPGDEDVPAADDLEDAAGVAGEGLEQGQGGQLVDVEGEPSLGVVC